MIVISDDKNDNFIYLFLTFNALTDDYDKWQKWKIDDSTLEYVKLRLEN